MAVKKEKEWYKSKTILTSLVLGFLQSIKMLGVEIPITPEVIDSISILLIVLIPIFLRMSDKTIKK